MMNIVKEILNIKETIQTNKELKNKIKNLENQNNKLRTELDKFKKGSKKIKSKLLKEEFYCDDYFKRAQIYREELELVLKTTIPNLINEKINDHNLKEIYEILKPLDKGGFILYRAVKNMTGINIHREFYAKSCWGEFVFKNGHELLEYLEIAKFGNPEYRFQGQQEVLSNYYIDYSSNKYVNFKQELYYITIINILEHLEIQPTNFFFIDEDLETVNISLSSIIKNLYLI